MSAQPVAAIARWIPAVDWLRHYQPAWLHRDLVAGVVTACVVVPQCVAYASLAGLPVEVGLYVATVPMAVRAARHLAPAEREHDVDDLTAHGIGDRRQR